MAFLPYGLFAGHLLLLFGFSPLDAQISNQISFLCKLRLALVAAVWLHYGLSKVCLCANFAGHRSQLYGLSPLGRVPILGKNIKNPK